MKEWKEVARRLRTVLGFVAADITGRCANPGHCRGLIHPSHVRSLNETRVSGEIASSELVKCCVRRCSVAVAACVETHAQPAACTFYQREREISFGKVKMAESTTIVTRACARARARARDIAGTVCINSARNRNVTQVCEINGQISSRPRLPQIFSPTKNFKSENSTLIAASFSLSLSHISAIS